MSLIWSALALFAAAVSAVYLAGLVYGGAHRPGRGNALCLYVLLAALAFAPAVSVLLRRRWHGYRAAVLVNAVVFSAIVILGGFSIGPFFVPAACFALLALATEAAGRRAG